MLIALAAEAGRVDLQDIKDFRIKDEILILPLEPRFAPTGWAIVRVPAPTRNGPSV